MWRNSKVRTPLMRSGPVAVWIFLALALAEAVFRDGKPAWTTWAFGAYFLVQGLTDAWRTRILSYFFLGLVLATGTWHSRVQWDPNWDFLSFKTYMLNVVVAVATLVIVWPTLRRQEKLDSNARRLLKLAAEQVSEVSDGFTSRPYSAGSVDQPRETLLGFARFVEGADVAKSVLQPSAVIVAFSTGVSPLKDQDLRETSYVSFGFDQTVGVHISQRDYGQYREQLKFDELCASLGNVFKRFLAYYEQGLENRILVELKAAGK